MSGFVLVHRRDGLPVAPELVRRMLDELSHRGSDAVSITTSRGLGLGARCSWDTPQEVGQQQPVGHPSGRFVVLFDGRIDNRDELVRELGAAAGTSDSRLAVLGWARWGRDLFARLLGPFAILVHERFTGRVVGARDPLGRRTLFFHATDRLLAIASEESALLAHPEIPDQLDSDTAASFFALEMPAQGSTFFSAIRELPPATVAEFEGRRRRTWRFWSPPSRRLRYRSDAEYAEQFGELLDRSVTSRLRSVTQPAILMSGGLDSTSIATLAARRLASGGAGPLTAVSWVFDELAECDEREFMDPVVASCGAQALRLPGDDAWPLRGGRDRWPTSPNTPFGNPYRHLLDRAYAAVREAGSRCILTGWFGDLLYAGQEEWWADLLTDRRYAEAGRELWGSLRDRRRPAALVRAALARTRSARLWRRMKPPLRRAWLTPETLLRLARPAGEYQRPDRARRMLEGSHVWAAKEETVFAGRAGIDVRHPYWDLRLVEFALAVPAHQLYRPGIEKRILRQAMRGLLPEVVRQRQGHRGLTALFNRGIMQLETESVHATLGGSGATWRRFVDSSWLETALEGAGAASLGGPESVVAWQSVAWELWRRALPAGSAVRTAASA